MIALRVWNKFRRFIRSANVRNKSKQLTNKNFSVISKDCTGALLLHELGLKFNSPTVNLYFTAGDFVKFCADLKRYLSLPVVQDFENDKNFPVGILDDIKVYFMHYQNFDEAVAKWYERSKRIDFDNLFIMMTDGEYSSPEIVKQFDELPYKHKVLFTYKDYPDVKSAVKLNIKNPVSNGIGAPHVFSWPEIFSFKQAVDDWDYIKFFNAE